MPVLFFIFWIVLNSKITLEIVIIGIFVSMMVSWFSYKCMGKSLKHELYIWKRFIKIIVYLCIVVKEVYLANIYMIEIVLSKDMELKPCLVFIKPPVKTKMGRVALANSITLTPGTITVSMVGDYFSVHCIDVGASEGLDSSIFVEKILELEED